jgi:hypothetical protein
MASSSRVELLRRAIVTLALAVWWGGLTFYGAVVVPVGTEVLGGATEQGFVTQRVTERLNVLGVVTLALLLWNLLASAAALRPGVRRALAVSLAIMLAAQLALFGLHARLDAMVNTFAHIVAAPHAQFYGVHRAYLLVSAAQWGAGLAHLLVLTVAWPNPARDTMPRGS